MIRKSRGLVALILALFLPVAFMLQAAATETSNDEYDRAVVLVLDRSGSMGGEPMRALKEAANKFCAGILSEDPDCMIAIVDYSSGTRSKDYTNDVTALESYVDSLSADSTTNMYDGVTCGEDYLIKINAKEKNMVIMADGLPNQGEYSVDGRYAKSESGNYKYANAIYNKVIGMDPAWRIFSLGFFHDLSGDTLSFAQRFMTDLGREGYFEATDTDALLSCFEEIASNIINPLTVSLSNSKVSPSSAEPTNTTDQYYRYLLKANIANSSDREAVNVVVRIILPDDFSICSGYSKEVAVGNIAAQGEVSLSWEVDILRPTTDTSSVYSVSAKAENSVEIEQSDIVYLAGYTVQDNRLARDDWWNFSNYYGDKRFGPQGENYYMTLNHREALLWNLSESKRAEIEACLDSAWGGSCYGMSSTVILTKMGVLSPADIQDGCTSLGSINKTNNDYVESYINYYHMMQLFPEVQAEIERFEGLGVTEQLTEIEGAAAQVRSDGTPILLCFSWSRSGHAIVGYDVESGDWRIDGVDYHKRIITYDCNTPAGSENSYLYYNLQEGEWTIPYYSVNERNAELALATDEIQLLECDSNIEVHTSNYIATITAKRITELYIKSGSQTYTVSEDGSASGGNIKVRYPFNYVEGVETESIVFVDINENDLSVPVEQDGGYIGVKFNDSYLAAETAQSGTLNFSADGSVAIDQTTGEFSVLMTSDETDASLPWNTVLAEGTGGSVSLQKEAFGGILLKSDSQEALTVEARNDAQTKSVTFENYGYDVLLKGEQNGSETELCAFVDTDGDGEYESKIGTSDEEDKDVVSVKPVPDEPSAPTPPPQENTPPETTGGGQNKVSLIAGLAVLALLAIGGAVIAVASTGKRKTEEDTASVEKIIYSVESNGCCTEMICYRDGTITKQEADQRGRLQEVSVYRLKPEEIESFEEWIHSMNLTEWSWLQNAGTGAQKRSLQISLKNGENFSASVAADLAEWNNLLAYLRKHSGAPQKKGICPACGAPLGNGVQMQPCGNCSYEYHMNWRKTPAQKQGGILVLTGDMRGALARISAGETICVGKEPLTCQLILGRDNRRVSRKHCAIAYCEKDNQYVVTDFSKNGTALEDGRKLPYNLEVTLSPGTVLLLGDDTCKIQLL